MEVLEKRVIEDWMMTPRGHLRATQKDVLPRYQSEKRCKRCGWIKGFEAYSRVPSGYLNPYCRTCLSERAAETPETTKIRQRRADILCRFGLSLEQRAEKLLQQGGCAICGVTEMDSGHTLSIDHDHRCCGANRACSDCVRGLLCRSCNTGLGFFADNVHLLTIAISYLQSYDG